MPLFPPPPSYTESLGLSKIDPSGAIPSHVARKLMIVQQRRIPCDGPGLSGSGCGSWYRIDRQGKPLLNIFLAGWTVESTPDRGVIVRCPWCAGSIPAEGTRPQRAAEETEMPPLFEPPKPSSPSPATNADTDSIDGDIAKTGSAYVKAAHFPAETPTRIFRVVSMERETFQDRDTRESYERPVLYGMFAGTTEELGLSMNATNMRKLKSLGMSKWSELYGHGLELTTHQTNLGPGVIIVKAVP